MPGPPPIFDIGTNVSDAKNKTEKLKSTLFNSLRSN